MKVCKGLFVVATLLATASLGLEADSDAQYRCPGNTKMVTITVNWQTQQYYQTMQAQQMAQQQSKLQMQQQMMHLSQTKQATQKTTTHTNMSFQTPITSTKSQIHPITEKYAHTTEKYAETTEKHTQTTTAIHHETHYIDKTMTAIHRMPGTIPSKITPQITHYQQAIHSTKMDLHKSTTTDHCSYLDTKKSEAKLPKNVEDLHKSTTMDHLQIAKNKSTEHNSKTDVTIDHKQTAIKKTTEASNKLDVTINKKVVTTDHSMTKTIMVVDDHCSDCHHKQAIAKNAGKLPTMVPHDQKPTAPVIAKQPASKPPVIGKQFPPLQPVVGKHELPPSPPFVGKELPGWQPPTVAMKPQTVLPPFVRLPGALDKPLVFLVPPTPKPLPVVIARTPLPTLNPLELPGFLRQPDPKTTKPKFDPGLPPLIAKVTKSPGNNKPAVLVEVPTEVYLSVPGKLPAEILMTPVLDQPLRTEQPAESEVVLTSLSVDELLQPAQRKLPAAVVQMPTLPLTDKQSTDTNLLPTSNDLAPTKRNLSDLLPVSMSAPASAPSATATKSTPQVLLQPLARNVNPGPG